MAIEIESSELRRITNDFSDAQKVGSGGYGDVYKVVYNGEAMAVKLLHATKGIDDTQFMKELRNHMKVQHPNIVRLVGYCNEETKKYVELPDGTSVFGRHIYKVLCFEYMVGRSLDKRLSGISLGDEWCTHYQIIKGTCEGLFYLHNGCENRILHLDLKPANVLLDKSMKPKIADFGLSRIYTASRSNIKVDSVSGTTKYMPPELIHGSEMSDKTDVYGLGVTIIEVIRGSGGFEIYHDSGDTNFVEDVCAYWRKRDSTTNLYQVETCAKIAVRCLNHDRRKRPTIKEIVENLNGMETQGLSKDLHALTVNSSPVPNKMSITISGRRALDVVIVYAFDCTDSTPAWYTVDNGIFWLVQEKLTNLCDSCMGYIYVMSTPNTYTSDMKVVDSAETKETGYTGFDWRRMTCSKNMASGLAEAHKMISNRGHHNGIILFFSDGLINKGDFFDATENFVSKVPVHTFTLGGDAYNHVLHSIAANSPGGMFHTSTVPERPNLSTPFSKLLDGLLGTTLKDDEMPLSYISGREPLDVVIVYAFDCTESTRAWYTMDNGIFWLLQEKLTHFPESCMGYIYVDMTPNTYTSDMKVVDPNETKETGYTRFAWRRMTCTKNMASGLADAHKMISNRGHHNGIILFFSDGLINKGDFFDGTENFVSKVPVHTFTLDGNAYNNVLHSIATNSPGGKFHTSPVPERPNLSTSFSKLLDNLLGGTPKDDERPISSISGREPLDVVIVYAFDCTEPTPAWYTVDNGIFWLLQEKLTYFPESCMGYIYVDMTPNTYTSDMKVVDRNETKETGYTRFAWRRMTCTKNMASGLADAHKMISNRGHHNGIILFFSDGLINKGDFFDGTENFVSKVPVHTFTLGGDAYNHVLHSVAKNSPGGKFHTSPVPERPNLSTSFSKLLDSLLGGTPEDDERPVSSISGREPLDVVIVYAFDCTDSTPAWHTVDSGVFWLVQEKLTHFPDSCMGYVYVDVTPNTYTSDMKVVDPAETKETGYTGFARRRMTCGKNMASGLAEAHKMLKNRDYHNGIILFFSDGLIYKGDFFDGTDNFISKVPVHTFTVGGDTYNHGLQAIATNSPGGTFNAIPVPERPHLSVPFSKLLDSLLSGTMEDRNHQ